jgi:hypothetical protein
LELSSQAHKKVKNLNLTFIDFLNSKNKQTYANAKLIQGHPQHQTHKANEQHQY